ncbi:hypothetical protein BHYA_0369g00040 [Botrytis hyacinthi]|uniref:Uncharacterized protein n=1 Tax=Botrytis hyacinthi TaxID=278943 RepID=A0A4Z1GD65_9HELO|nr:hypothetical protein BHYA_0369g00040 [Botrytis hyacinthi]
MENNNLTLRSMFTLGDCGAAIGRQYSRICGSSRSYRDDTEAYIPGQTELGPSIRDSNRRRSHPTPTSRPVSRGPDTHGLSSRHLHPPISSQAQPYHRLYPDARSRPKNETVRYSTQIPRFQESTYQPIQYSTPSPSAQSASANSRRLVTPGKFSLPSSSSRQMSSIPRSRVSTRESHSRGAKNTGAKLNPTILGPNGYAYISPNVSTRRETAESGASYELDESRFEKEDV